MNLRHSCATLLFAQRVASSDDRGSARAQLAIYVDVLREVQGDAVDRLGHCSDRTTSPTHDH
jgi:hypothetical protein